MLVKHCKKKKKKVSILKKSFNFVSQKFKKKKKKSFRFHKWKNIISLGFAHGKEVITH